MAADRTHPQNFRFDPVVECLEGAWAGLEPADALRTLSAERRPALLDSASGEPARFSLLGFDPLPPEPPQDLLGLRAFVQRLERVPGPAAPCFDGGFLGALAYDLGVAGEDQGLPTDPWGLPRIVGGLYVDFLVREHASGQTFLVLGREPGDGRAPVEERRRSFLGGLQAIPRETPAGGGRGVQRLTASKGFQEGVEAVRERIAAGDIYQANLSHRLISKTSGNPIELYAELRRNHPGPYMGYLGQPGLALLSGSPELLLDYEPGQGGRPARALTRPIKGTAPRSPDPGRDQELAAELLASAKDRAELTMIVDLERNDLGRIARPGGVETEPFPELMSFATVHHLMADVSADVAPEKDAVDVLAALFPGGSITGTPKLSSMRVIAELEGEGRGFAYGSMLMLDTRGRCLANILIRTLIWRPSAGGAEVTYRVGGGITYASDAALEEAESLTKGEALARTLGALDV